MYILRTFCGDYDQNLAGSQLFTAGMRRIGPPIAAANPSCDYAVRVMRNVQSRWQLLQVAQRLMPVIAVPAATFPSSGTSSWRRVSRWSAILLTLIFIA